MSKPDPNDLASKIVMQGIHLTLTPAMQAAMREKFAVLVRHNAHIIRVDLRLQHNQTAETDRHFTAHGRIEIGGPDLIASADNQDPYAALDALVDKLDRLLERRHGLRKDRRNHPHEIELEANLPQPD